MPGLQSLIEAAFLPVFGELAPGVAAAVRPSARADFQVDGAIALARSLGRPSRDVAEDVVSRANARGLGLICAKVEVAGPGFINLTLADEFLGDQLRRLAAEPARLGVERALPPQRVVVDYGGPNAAKEMHVGHLRSSIIGDALVRLLSLEGHSVLRENHIGDWGAPFGMLIEHLKDMDAAAAAEELALGDLETFYQAARADFDNDPSFAERVRERVVLLQSGDPDTLRLWRLLVERSITQFDQAFRRLGTKLTRDDVVAESRYNPMLQGIVGELQAKGLLVESDGAWCVFPPGHTNRQGGPLPLIVQNSVGGYTYATTDLAAVKDRTGRLGAQRLLYVVGLPQAQHLSMVFDVARMAGWLPPGTEAVHVGFGNVLGPDGKMFRTRQGGTVKLAQLLDEAVSRARAVIVARADESGQAVEGDLDAISEAVGIGAVKYSDLVTDRTRDYRFDWDRMLALDGNTAPYMQYAHARICSIFRKARAGAHQGAAGTAQAIGSGAITDSAHLVAGPAAVRPPSGSEERELAKRLLGFADAVAASLASYSPHKLCTYLFDLAGTFTTFYEHCPVLRAETEELRDARLALCALTAAELRMGLDLLGIAAPERM
ncbi:MAG TPA: arginine--tRNA ligase [Acidimicrobiales bacterium]|nr:arginine--tRNA ligase [Acidimicrobiales bacterium]